MKDSPKGQSLSPPVSPDHKWEFVMKDGFKEAIIHALGVAGLNSQTPDHCGLQLQLVFLLQNVIYLMYQALLFD